jgi:hypothetical protein
MIKAAVKPIHARPTTGAVDKYVVKFFMKDVNETHGYKKILGTNKFGSFFYIRSNKLVAYKDFLIIIIYS